MGKLRISNNTYSLRQAAGQYWLLDMSQKGIWYKHPMTFNEVGADIWKMMEQGYTVDEIIGALSEEYEIPASQLQEDVLQFINQLRAYGVKIED